MPATPAAEWKAANRKESALPSGRAAVIRKLTAEFLLVIQGLTENLLAVGEMAAKPVHKIRQHLDYVRALVQQAVVDPKVAPDDRDPRDDEVAVDDFGEDLDALLKAIHEWNEGILVTPFRAAADGSTPGPAGEGVSGRREPEPVGEEATA